MNQRQSTKILVVEDELITSIDIVQYLQDFGYEVVGIASYGEVALEKVAELHPDLVLMDIKLKGYVDGVETAKQIQALYDIPVVYLTAHSDEQTLQRVKQTTHYGYIVKPFNKAELRVTIEQALQQHMADKKT